MVAEQYKTKEDTYTTFRDYFLKFLKESSSFEEAFSKAEKTYHEIFNKNPYQDCQSFLSEFYHSQYNDENK